MELGLIALAAGLAVGLSALATGYAQARIGAAAMGAVAEKPELTGRAILLVAIPETLVILGFAVAAMIILLLGGKSMALRDLLTALEEEGAAEHEKAQQDRRRQADQILADAQRAQPPKLHAGRRDGGRDRARQEAEALLIAARSAARRAARTARDDALEEVLGQVREQLLALPGSRGRRSGSERLRWTKLSPRCHTPPWSASTRPTRRRCGQTWRRSWSPTSEHGGAIAEDDHGRYIDNTYLTRLANTWPEIRAELSRSWDQES